MRKPDNIKEVIALFAFILPRFSSAIVILSCLLLIVFLNSNNLISQKVREFGNTGSSFILNSFNYTYDLFPNVPSFFSQLLASMNENSMLKSENDSLRIHNRELEVLLAEHRALTKDLNFIVPDKLNRVAIRVSSVDISGAKHHISALINDSSKFIEGTPVVFKDMLIGKVVSIDGNTLKIQLITDSSFKISSLTLIGEKKCMLKGTGNLNSLNATCIDFDPRYYNSKEEVITAGNDGVFPYGLLVGEISSSGDEFKVMVSDILPSLRFVQLLIPTTREAND